MGKENLEMKQMMNKSDENLSDVKKMTHRVVKLKEMMRMEEKYK